jgi:carboxymethylenebutenolidase
MHINAVTEAQLAGDLEAAIAVLRAEGATSIGVTGFCMGGRFSYRAAKWAQRLGVSAAVGFYGDIAKELSNPRCPTLLLFGGRDEWIPADDIAAACTHHGEAVVVYPDANHGFMRDGTRFYDEAAAADAWARLLAFFDRHLD